MFLLFLLDFLFLLFLFLFCRFFKKYIKKYENVRLIDRLENRGVSETRNEGIEYSCGRFLMFVDADDVLESGAIQKIETLIRADASIDTVFFEYSVLKDGIKRHCFRQIEAKDCRKFNKKMAERMVLGIDFNSPCTIVYSKRIIDENNIRFDSQLALGEDFKFNTQYLHEFSNGAYIKESLYIYRMREGSATNSFSIKKVKDTGKRITATFKRNSDMQGYQIQVARDKKFKKGKKSFSYGNSGDVSAYGLKKGTYYVRIRAYKTRNVRVNHNYETRYYYSGWSTVKKVYVK